jgi:hypothetical protein
MRRPIGLALLGGAIVLSGCFTASFPMTVTTTKAVFAKPAGCDFQVVATKPQGDFTELASFRSAGRGVNDLGDFKHAVQTDACRVGAEFVLVQTNGYGNVVQATALRKTDELVPFSVSCPSGKTFVLETPGNPKRQCSLERDSNGMTVGGRCDDGLGNSAEATCSVADGGSCRKTMGAGSCRPS